MNFKLYINIGIIKVMLPFSILAEIMNTCTCICHLFFHSDVCQDQCPTWQKCRIDDKGKPTCECEECTAEESQPDSRKSDNRLNSSSYVYLNSQNHVFKGVMIYFYNLDFFFFTGLGLNVIL